MKRVIALACLFLCLALSFSVAAQVPDPGLPVGELAKGSIQPVPGGELVVGVAEGGIDGMGGKRLISGPPGFLMSRGEGPGLNVEGSNNTRYHLDHRGAVFLPGNIQYTLGTGGDWGAGFRFIGFGTGIKSDDTRGRLFYSKSVSWGPGVGKAFDVSLMREAFRSGSSTPWHRHSGPAFGILEGGLWENRQSDGVTVSIIAPGYYAQPVGTAHQLAQVGEGGYALSLEFYPPDQPKTTEATGPGLATPTTLVLTTPVPDLNQSPPPTFAPAATEGVMSSTGLITPTTNVVRGDAASQPDWRGGWVLLIFVIGLAFVGLFSLLRSKRRQAGPPPQP